MMAAESLEGRLEPVIQRPAEAEYDVFQQYLQMIQRESERCRKITGKTARFRPGQRFNSATAHDLTGLVSEVLDMVQHLSKYREKQIEFSPTAPASSK